MVPVGPGTGDGGVGRDAGDDTGASVKFRGSEMGDASVAAGVGAIVMGTSVKLHESGQLFMTKHSHGNGKVIVSSPST